MPYSYRGHTGMYKALIPVFLGATTNDCYRLQDKVRRTSV